MRDYDTAVNPPSEPSKYRWTKYKSVSGRVLEGIVRGWVLEGGGGGGF